MSKSKLVEDDDNEVRVGDTREGTGGLHVRVRVDEIDGDEAKCALIRSSGRSKWIRLATLRKAYKLVSRGEPSKSLQEKA
jgi:hypothetical protein